jgi:hypothetical protein
LPLVTELDDESSDRGTEDSFLPLSSEAEGEASVVGRNISALGSFALLSVTELLNEPSAKD